MVKINPRLILVALSLAFFSCSNETYDLHIKDVFIVDLENKRLVKANLLINDNRIVKVDSTFAHSKIKSKKELNGTGKYMIPGLWDSHVHLIEEANYKGQLDGFVQFGITSVRDSGGNLDSLKAWDSNISKGLLRGPDIYYAGPTLNGPKEGDAAYTITVNDTSKANILVDSLRKGGVDFIKIHDRVDIDILAKIIQSAHKHNLPVAGHVPFGIGIVEASNLGMNSLEHVSALIAAAVYNPDNSVSNLGQAYQYLQDENGKEIWKSLKANRTFVTPTLINYKYIVEADPDEQSRQLGRRGLQAQQEIVTMMYNSGVSLLAGTDFGIPELEMKAGETLIEELELISEAGIDNYEVIKMATLNAAEFFGMDNSVGLIKAGYNADLVLLDRNPIENISNLYSVHLVIQNGKIQVEN